MSRKLRIVQIGGSGDAFHTFRCWSKNEADTRTSHVSYSSQFFEACRALRAEALCLPSFPSDERLSHDGIAIESRPNPLVGQGGLAFYRAQLEYARQIAADVRSFRANTLLVMDDVLPSLVARALPPDVRMVQMLPCTLWPEYGRTKPARRAALCLQKRFYRKDAAAILSASNVITRQVRTLAGGETRPILEFLPLYEEKMYGVVEAPVRSGPELRVLFIGRVEQEKGVFELLEVARQLGAAGRNEIRFDVCGTGGALEALKGAAVQAGLERTFVLHGWCDQARLREIYRDAHAVVVPTPSLVGEGFNQVVVESLLAGRPVITSRVCPALDYVRDAVLEVPPDDVSGYLKAVIALADDRDLYWKLQAACASMAAPFRDAKNSYGAALGRVLRALSEDTDAVSSSIPTVKSRENEVVR